MLNDRRLRMNECGWTSELNFNSMFGPSDASIKHIPMFLHKHLLTSYIQVNLISLILPIDFYITKLLFYY